MGVPREILTDQGSNFTSQLLAELYRLLQVRPIRTSPYHPETDGLVERRFNQTLKSMLRKAVTETGKDWDKMIPYLLFAYRELGATSINGVFSVRVALWTGCARPFGRFERHLGIRYSQ